MVKTMAEIIREHQPTTGMSVASGVTCQCGYWNGEERAGVNRPVGFQGLIWHQGQELEAAGYGLVADAKREAQARAYDKGYTHGRYDEKHHPQYSLSGTPRPEKSRRNPYRAAAERGGE